MPLVELRELNDGGVGKLVPVEGRDRIAQDLRSFPQLVQDLVALLAGEAIYIDPRQDHEQ